MRADLYIDAARRVTPGQAAGRLRRLVPPRLLAARPGEAPGWAPLAGGLGVRAPRSSAPAPAPASDGIFRAVGSERSAAAAGFWTDERDGLLFLFHLHGFERLAEYADSEHSDAGDAFWAHTIGSWLDRFPQTVMPAWHPYPTSTRIVAWAAALSSRDAWPSALRERMRQSLWRQARYLSRAVERDIGGNHVIRNATALTIAGSVFEALAMRERGLSILEGETAAQVLDDGGHEERSTSYQRVVAADLRDVATVLERAGVSAPWLTEALERMDRWASEACGPGGELPLLNDAWSCRAPAPRSERATSDLAASGLQILRHGADQLLFDAGPLAPDHLPPHAHADALSVLVWLDGEALTVDPGAFSYTGPWRNRFRATAAHNTVEVEAADQCEFWGDFRLAFPPRVCAERPLELGEATMLRATHDGYRRLRRPATHERVVIWWPPNGAIVLDRLLGEGSYGVRSRLHLAPGLEPGSGGTVGAATIRAIGAEATVIAGDYSPFLGSREPILVLEDAREIAAGECFGWSILRAGAEVTSLSGEAIELRDRAGKATSIALPRS